jgi:hypothetical protein
MVPLAAGKNSDEPLLPIIAALSGLVDGELGLFQVLFQQVQEPWRESVLRAVTTPTGQPFFTDAPEITKLAVEKVSSPLFAVVVRLAAVAKDGERVWEILRHVAAGLAHFGSPQLNELMPLPTEDLEMVEQDLLDRTTHRSGMLLSADELESLVHLPGSGVQVPELWRSVKKTRPAPAEVASSGCLLGENEHEGRSAPVRLPVGAKTKHVHVVGSSGTGKSTLLVRMILEDIEAGHGVGVLDPHGDLVDEVAARMPAHPLDDVVLFDPADDKVRIGWNVLGAGSDVEKDLLASDLVGVFRRLSTSWGDQMTAVLANAILVFLESERGGTLSDLRRFLVDPAFRKELLGTVRDPHVTAFWETEFSLLIGRKPQTPILTRLDTFLRSRLVRRVVTVREPKLDFREVTDQGLVFLGKLASGAIGEENAALLGSLLVSKFHQVTLARAGQAEEQRRPFFLYIDEFHNVATPSMAALFSGMRKYRLGLAVAHQDLYQLHRAVPEVERSLLANAYTRICFRLGDEDARQLAKGFGHFEPEDLMGLGLGEAICRVGGREADFNLRTSRLPALDRQDAQQQRERLRRASATRWGSTIEDGEPRASPAPDAAPEADEAPTPAPPSPTDDASAPEAASQLDKLSLDYLQLVATDPFLSVRERNQELRLSAWRGNRVRSELLERALLREVPVNPGGRGKRLKLLELTSDGRELLASYGIAPASGHGRGGVAHQWWVRTIADWLSERGLPPSIEDESRGARVDIRLDATSGDVAIEIEMTDGHALENIRKDLAAGFEHVVCLLDTPRAGERVRQGLGEESDQVPPGVRIGELQNFEAMLAPLVDPRSAPLRAPSQDKEPRARRRRRSASPAPLQTERSGLFEGGALPTPLAADYLGLSPATLETLRSRGGGPAFLKLGRRVVYQREDLDKWLAERRRTSTSDSGQSV